MVHGSHGTISYRNQMSIDEYPLGIFLFEMLLHRWPLTIPQEISSNDHLKIERKKLQKANIWNCFAVALGFYMWNREK